MSGILTISLDFELHWGGFEKWVLPDYDRYFLNTRRVIPELLALFERFEIHATWATVGLLFHGSKDEAIRNFPVLKPTYERSDLSAYAYMERFGIGENEESDPFHYAPSLIRRILETPHQEIGTHTFAHYYCDEEGQTPDQFREDLRAARRAAEPYGIDLRSLAFPRNQYSLPYLEICAEEGIRSVRTNPDRWFWRRPARASLCERFVRTLDAYLPTRGGSAFPLSAIRSQAGVPISIPASRFLRPYRRGELFLNGCRLRRIRAELDRAARAGEVYHLWWHPHNFGHYPEESLRALAEICECYRNNNAKLGMSSFNMDELATMKLESEAPSNEPRKA